MCDYRKLQGWILVLLPAVVWTASPMVDLGMLSTKSFFFFFLPQLKAFCVFDLENIAGKLVFYQMEGNATYVRDTGELASDVPTETMFELYDPQKNFSKTNFSYTWDLGNGYEESSHLRFSKPPMH